VNDWLTEGLNGRAEETVNLNRNVLKPVVAYLGDIELRKLTAHDVRRALTELASRRSSRTVVVTHNALTRAIRHAEANRHVLHNVAALVDTPKGQKGRPSSALTAEQAAALLKAAQDARLGAYVVLCLLTGIRTEEARALRWDHVDLDAAAIAVWRSVRRGGDTKTERSCRTLQLPQTAAEALRHYQVRQASEKLAAGELWKDHGLGVHHHARDTAWGRQRQATVQGHLHRGRDRVFLGPARASDQLRKFAISLRCAGRGDCPIGRTLQFQDNGGHIP